MWMRSSLQIKESVGVPARTKLFNNCIYPLVHHDSTLKQIWSHLRTCAISLMVLRLSVIIAGLTLYEIEYHIKISYYHCRNGTTLQSQ